MPTEVQRRSSEPLPVGPRPATTSPMDHFAVTKAQQQQQLQHREALRLALGSILTPVSKRLYSYEQSLSIARLLCVGFLNGKKRPSNAMSRSSSGTASPAHPSPFGLPGSGAHTPIGTPPTASPYFTGHGPNSSEHLLHPHHAFHGHAHTPSRLGRSASNSNSPSESAETTAPSSSHPSPLPDMGAGIDSTTGLPLLPDLEPLPPAMTSPQQQESSTESAPSGYGHGHPRPMRPSISPLHSSKDEDGVAGVPMDGMATDHADATQSGRGTPRAKFLQTLQGKSAWDALIHGSFT